MKSKELRGQLRQIAKELLTEELVKVVEEKLRKEMNIRLAEIDAKQKDLLSYIIRNSAKGN